MPEGVINISVRGMVEFILRSGSIDAGYTSANRAQEGTRLHQKVQKDRKVQAQFNNAIYVSEVPVKISFTYKDFLFNMDGRADGVLKTQDYMAIEEIKSTGIPLDSLAVDPEHWHWAQAKCYGHMLAAANDLSGVKILLTYCQLETEETVTFENEYTAEELEIYFMGIVEKYLAFASMDVKRVKLRNETAKSLAFPYGNYRRGQRELCVSVYTAIKNSKKLFAQAPTGIGKTISTLYPSVKALGEGLGEKIFYLTAKTITRQAAEEAFLDMRSRGLYMRAVTLTAKEKICILSSPNCNPKDCAYANGHFNRVNDAILDVIANETMIDRRIVEKYAHKHSVCPHEFSFDISLFCDLIICDYNYVYDPSAYLRRYFAENTKTDFIVLHDEAHNLVDRARDMFSASLTKSDFLECRRYFDRKSTIYKSIGKVNLFFLEAGKEMAEKTTNVHENSPTELLNLLNDLSLFISGWLQDNEQSPEFDMIIELYFRILDFLRTGEYFDSRYVTFMERSGRDITISLMCIDPSHLLSLAQKKMRSCVFFSATLTPLDYFRDVLGGDGESYTLRLASPFDKKNLCLLVENAISTRYRNRENSLSNVVDSIYEMASARKGNYMAFFSSYEYMNKVSDLFMEKYRDMPAMIQSRSMEEEQREEFLQKFRADSADSLVAFVVLGGLFSEGIDLKGERLIGVAVIGVGLPLISPQRDVIADYYKNLNGMGFEYAYQYPGMNKVLQAAGRVIRSETDRGVVLLIDDRFLSHAYRSLFPDEWTGYERIRSGRISGKVKEFWVESF